MTGLTRDGLEATPISAACNGLRNAQRNVQSGVFHSTGEAGALNLSTFEYLVMLVVAAFIGWLLAVQL